MLDNDRLPAAENHTSPQHIFVMLVSLLFLPMIFLIDHFLFGVLRSCLEVVAILYTGSTEQTRSALLIMGIFYIVSMGLLVFKVYALPICIQKVRTIRLASIKVATFRWSYSFGVVILGAVGFASIIGLFLFAVFFRYYPDAALSLFSSPPP